MEVLTSMGIDTPTPIQALSIGPVLDGKDVIAKAETGTGKTLAFGAPMMARIDPARSSVLGLVLCPTRELSEQVFQVLVELGRARGVKVALIVGGEPMHPQVEALQNGGQVVVGTPGRVLDLMNQGFLSFPWTEYVVLDEADKMLEIGFIDDVKKILAATPDERQTLLFSATFPNELLSLARASTRDPAEVATAAGLATVDAIEQFYLEVTDEDRPRALARLIDRSEKDDVFLVFCDRRTDVDRLFRRLERERFSSKALHGGYDQAARFRVMTAFRTGEVKALLATDVASRGLDVEHVTHVVNFGVPRDAADYTHRIGRTGRAGRKGTAITFVADGDQRRWRSLLSQLTWKIGTLEARGARRSSTTRSERPAREQDEVGSPARRARGE
jgi:ATP-dependent RNA helicase DeaD